MSSPEKVFGSGKRDAAKVSSDRSQLPADDQTAYLVLDPTRGPTPRKAEQRKKVAETGVRDPEDVETPED